MALGNLADIADLVAAARVIASPIYVGYPVKQTQTAVRSLSEATVFDSVEHSPENAGRVLHGLFVTDLCARGTQVHCMRPLIECGDLELS